VIQCNGGEFPKRAIHRFCHLFLISHCSTVLMTGGRRSSIYYTKKHSPMTMIHELATMANRVARFFLT
jgi:hypothetical protein